jgi:dTDP-4-amino-4,6-dideoxygalactose transaminase
VENRDELKSYLLTKNIATEIHYPLAPSNQIAYRKFFEHSKYPISERIHDTTLSLPISYSTTLEDVKIVVDAINHFFKR